MKKIFLIILIAVILTFAGDKKPVYKKKAVEIQRLESQAKQLQEKRSEALKFIEQIDKEMLILQGQYSMWSDPTMPDSIIQKDTSKTK